MKLVSFQVWETMFFTLNLVIILLKEIIIDYLLALRNMIVFLKEVRNLKFDKRLREFSVFLCPFRLKISILLGCLSDSVG